jgi:Asp-tRNA(Asn)/Glu-tRNA(Gln) amidotransferase A subunit family amidase
MDEELQWMPAWRLRDMMVTGTVSPVEVMRDLLERIDRLGPVLNPFITVAAEQALDSARRAEQAIVAGERLGPLHGVPVSVKDLFWTRGIRTTYGSKLFEDFVPEQDCIFVERLREAGAIIFAKNNTSEFGQCHRTLNLVAGECLTPWDAQLVRSSGGSSGGSAVSVAAGLGPISIGSDSGGSIRIPSSFNGVFGFMTSRGRIPVGPRSYYAPMQSIGPITLDVRDAATALSIIAGHDERDPWSASSHTPDYLAGFGDGVQGMRMAWSPDLGRIQPSQPEVVDVAYQAARVFGELGAKVDEPRLRLQNPVDPLEPTGPISFTEAFQPEGNHADYYQLNELVADARRDPVKSSKLTVYVREPEGRLDYAMSIPPRVRYQPIDDLDDVFSRYDLLLCPVVGRTAFVAGDSAITSWEYTEYSLIFNVAGYCGASMPGGLIGGLPVGLQIIAPPEREPLVLRAARAFEQARPWAQIRPPTR